MNDLFSLAGKNILITGSAQGIGFLLATGLGKYGAQIIINEYYCRTRRACCRNSTGGYSGRCRTF